MIGVKHTIIHTGYHPIPMLENVYLHGQDFACNAKKVIFACKDYFLINGALKNDALKLHFYTIFNTTNRQLPSTQSFY